jgi:hypothetical protein
MSLESDEKSVLEVLREAKISLGSSNPQMFFKSMIDNFNSDLSDFGEDSNNESADFDLSTQAATGPMIHRRGPLGGAPSVTLAASIENISALLDEQHDRGTSRRTRARTGGKPPARGGVNVRSAAPSSSGNVNRADTENENESDSDNYETNGDNDDTPSLSLPDSFDSPHAPLNMPGLAGFPGIATLGDMGSLGGKTEALNILERIKAMNQFRAQRDQTVTYLRTFKDLEANLRGEITKLKSLIEDRNYMFQNLLLSDSKFRELRLKRADELSTHDLACVRATELLMPLRDELEMSRRKTEQLLKDQTVIQASEAQLRVELARERKLAEVAAESHTMEYTSLDQRCRRLSALLDSESNGRRAAEDKANHHDVVVEENKKLITEVC